MWDRTINERVALIYVTCTYRFVPDEAVSTSSYQYNTSHTNISWPREDWALVDDIDTFLYYKFELN